MILLASTLIVALTPRTPQAQGPVPRSGAYVAHVGAAVIAREQYRLEGPDLHAQVELVSQSLTLTTDTHYGANLVPDHFHLAARRTGAPAVLQELDVQLADSARWTLTTGERKQPGASPLTEPHAVMQNLQFSHLAMIVLGYDRAKGGAQAWHAWLPQGAATVTVNVTLTGDSGTVDVHGTAMNVTVDGSGWLTRVDVPAQGLTVTWQPQLDKAPDPPRAGSADTVAPKAALESPYRFSSGSVTLAGTLTLPAGAAGKVPVALIIAGSGPTDRDGNSALGEHANMYAQLAWRLAERGIATLRYDKRGLGESSRQFDMAQTTFDDFANDAVAGARALAADQRFGPVVLVGHSEGASLAMRAANSGAPVAGIALLAGVGRPFTTVLREQLAAQFDAATVTRFDTAFAAYLKGDDPGDLPAAMRALVLPVNRRFLQTLVARDPIKEIRAVSVPVLIVQGSTDVQVRVADAEALAAAKPDARVVIVPDANHVFKRAPAGSAGNQAAQYLDPTLPIVPELVDAVVQWVGSLH